MTYAADVQTLAPGSEIVLLQVDLTPLGGEMFRLHAVQHEGPLVYRGLSFDPWSFDIEGLAKSSSTAPQPKLTVSNKDLFVSSLCDAFDDCVGATVVIYRTLTKYLDAVNFEGGNPTADPNEGATPEIWKIWRKAVATPQAVQFELASAVDSRTGKLPARKATTRCPWVAIGGYRGEFCGYTGAAVAKLDGTPTSSLAEDKCPGTLGACKLREWPDGIMNFGGFPSLGLRR